MYNLIISEAAKDDMKESSEWYEEQKTGLSKQFLKEVFLKLQYIENNPLLYSIRFSGKFHFAKVSRFPFLIVYEIFEGSVIINAVFHTSKNPQNF
jgi:plasmid stabilization system protein ParE